MKNEFIMFVGPMFGGKTTKLLSAIDRYKYQHREILVFKPRVDERYSKEEIVSHWGHKLNAIRIDSGKNIDNMLLRKEYPDTVIAVDEAFMIPGIADALIALFQEGYTILVSSLQLSSDATPCMEIMHMMPWATKIEVCPAVCPITGEDAYYTKKIGGRSDHQIEIGGSEMYQPRTHSEFFE